MHSANFKKNLSIVKWSELFTGNNSLDKFSLCLGLRGILPRTKLGYCEDCWVSNLPHCNTRKQLHVHAWFWRKKRSLLSAHLFYLPWCLVWVAW